MLKGKTTARAESQDVKPIKDFDEKMLYRKGVKNRKQRKVLQTNGTSAFWSVIAQDYTQPVKNVSTRPLILFLTRRHF